MTDDKTPVPDCKLSVPDKPRIFADIPREHPFLKLDDTVRINDMRNRFYNRTGTIENMRIGDQFQIVVRVDGEGGELAYLYSQSDVVRLEDELERTLDKGQWVARINRSNISGNPVSITVHGFALPETGVSTNVMESQRAAGPQAMLKEALDWALLEHVLPAIIGWASRVEKLARDMPK